MFVVCIPMIFVFYPHHGYPTIYNWGFMIEPCWTHDICIYIYCIYAHSIPIIPAWLLIHPSSPSSPCRSSILFCRVRRARAQKLKNYSSTLVVMQFPGRSLTSLTIQNGNDYEIISIFSWEDIHVDGVRIWGFGWWFVQGWPQQLYFGLQTRENYKYNCHKAYS